MTLVMSYVTRNFEAKYL